MKVKKLSKWVNYSFKRNALLDLRQKGYVWRWGPVGRFASASGKPVGPHTCKGPERSPPSPLHITVKQEISQPRKGWFEFRVIITDQIIYPTQLQSESYFINNYVTPCNTVYAMLFISEFLTTLWECYILCVYIDVESVFNWLNMSEITRHWQMKLSL